MSEILGCICQLFAKFFEKRICFGIRYALEYWSLWRRWTVRCVGKSGNAAKRPEPWAVRNVVYRLEKWLHYCRLLCGGNIGEGFFIIFFVFCVLFLFFYGFGLERNQFRTFFSTFSPSRRRLWRFPARNCPCGFRWRTSASRHTLITSKRRTLCAQWNRLTWCSLFHLIFDSLTGTIRHQLSEFVLFLETLFLHLLHLRIYFINFKFHLDWIQR